MHFGERYQLQPQLVTSERAAASSGSAQPLRPSAHSDDNLNVAAVLLERIINVCSTEGSPAQKLAICETTAHAALSVLKDCIDKVAGTSSKTSENKQGDHEFTPGDDHMNAMNMPGEQQLSSEDQLCLVSPGSSYDHAMQSGNVLQKSLSVIFSDIESESGRTSGAEMDDAAMAELANASSPVSCLHRKTLSDMSAHEDDSSSAASSPRSVTRTESLVRVVSTNGAPKLMSPNSPHDASPCSSPPVTPGKTQDLIQNFEEAPGGSFKIVYAAAEVGNVLVKNTSRDSSESDIPNPAAWNVVGSPVSNYVPRTSKLLPEKGSVDEPLTPESPATAKTVSALSLQGCARLFEVAKSAQAEQCGSYRSGPWTPRERATARPFAEAATTGSVLAPQFATFAGSMLPPSVPARPGFNKPSTVESLQGLQTGRSCNVRGVIRDPERDHLEGLRADRSRSVRRVMRDPELTQGSRVIRRTVPTRYPSDNPASRLCAVPARYTSDVQGSAPVVSQPGIMDFRVSSVLHGSTGPKTVTSI